MNLSKLSLPLYVSTTDDDPIKDFFDPVFARASTYDIAVGYFSSHWLRDAACGIAHFALNGGKARWIISPYLSQEDFNLLSGKDDAGELSVSDVISRSFDALYSELTQHTREALGWLIKDGVLTFRVGIPKNSLNGIMHAKQGLFSDLQGHSVGFLGSYNLTGAAGSNWEAFSVFCSWKSEESLARITAIRQSFQRMWAGTDPNLDIYDPKEKDLEKFVRDAEAAPRHYDLLAPPAKHGPKIPDAFLTDGRLRPYQEDGIRQWLANNGRGILHMATGTGKTVTALTAITRVCEYTRERGSQILTVVAVPYQHLAEQWADEARQFGFAPVLCYGGVSRWMGDAQRQLNELQMGTRHQCMFITVNATMRDGPFQALLRSARSSILFVGDEMHNLGARSLLDALPESALFRMGLSATPDRAGDEEGTDGLRRYFGPTVLEFGLDKAIAGGFLCRYFYHPVLVSFTEAEQLEYAALSRQISRLYAAEAGGREPDSDQLKKLLIRRARLIGKAENKLPRLLELLQQQQDVHHTLVYCGDSMDDGEKYIERALSDVGNRLKLRANKFTAEEGPLERKRLLSEFAAGRLQVLLAIRCLDEGVDVPMTQTAYILASSANPKEFVQRRGRILRRAPGKQYAMLYDFITVPDLDQLDEDSGLAVERSLLKREIKRFNEFAALAENHGEALERITALKQRLHLLDH